MPTLKHPTYVSSTTGVVKYHGNSVMCDIFQAHCECDWHGPRRTRQWEADDDAANHEKNPQEA